MSYHFWRFCLTGKESKSLDIIKSVFKSSLLKKGPPALDHALLWFWSLDYKKDENRLAADGIMLMRDQQTTLSLKRNDDILQDLHTKPIIHYITKCQQNWQDHVNRMNDTRIPKAQTYYNSIFKNIITFSIYSPSSHLK